MNNDRVTVRPRRFCQQAIRTFVLALIWGSAFLISVASTAGTERVAFMLQLNGAVSPASADYVIRGIKLAGERHVALVVLQMDTPGGLDTSMREIIRAILASSVPVASFVAPSGARAASAGTYILYASHIAAMAPGTNLGAATPIALGGGGEDDGRDGESKKPQSRSAAETKAVNDAAAYLRGLAELRNRNADWAEKAVREAASLSSTAAEREKIIDFVAATVDELMAKANGRTVRVGEGDIRLDTTGLMVQNIEPDWRTRLLSVIADPNVALILMVIGIYGLIFEFLTPGAVIPGTVGGICLLLGLYALAMLPVSYAGVGLIVLAVGLLVAEAHAPSFGVLGLGGAVALVLGATILFDTDVPELEVSRQVLVGIAISALAFSLIVVRLAFVARRHAVVTGAEQMIGISGTVSSWTDTSGYIVAHGERWSAVSAERLSAGDDVRVIARDGLTLEVARNSRKDRQPLEGREERA
ncbi:nodulation protein NfeD [Rhizobium sp. KVB221]|uniref:Nodulation protein NfeD n=1 Tax=Rhizobium setariae TaxID=2801340 RepID=A0A937CQ88_9HYPH|nr:nodulation protein NfeD [Rhizobium setariae]MBL0373538.1 nodulation protein NfeD [Rhizobium setariae]